ncbi:MAG: nicotinamide riboside transporter PnuC [Flavobacteriales bacterium]|nr:nicotinamide riboside transporter PnuC [Flavobacteriales bacterium]
MGDVLYSWFLAPYQSYTLTSIVLEALAAVFGILSVWFAKKNNIWVYPTGIISTATYVFLLVSWGVYGDAVINVYYTVMSVYGWWVWANVRKGDDEDSLSITRLSHKGWSFTLVFTVINFAIFYFILSRYTDSTVPMLDAITTALAFAAMYLMARKKVENWAMWIACDVISVGLYIYKGYGVTALQYLVFLVLAVFAHFAWVKMYNEQKTQHKA